MNPNGMTLEEFFMGQADSQRLFDALHAAISAIGPAEVRVTKSHVAFRRRTAFAWAWMPRTVLRGRGAPLVLSLALHRQDVSARWKQVVEPYPGRFTHHLELYSVEEVDGEVQSWLVEAWEQAA